MLKVLQKMRDFYTYEQWMVFVEQAKTRGKITEKEYEQLKEDEY